VFQDDLIRTYRAFLDKRRAVRPEAEYREPTETGMARVRTALRTTQDRTGHLRAPLRNSLSARVRLHTLPKPAGRPTPATPACRDHREPRQPHRRGTQQRLARRGSWPDNQLGSSQTQTRQPRPSDPGHHARWPHQPRDSCSSLTSRDRQSRPRGSLRLQLSSKVEAG
jgi:hypothetical protein